MKRHLILSNRADVHKSCQCCHGHDDHKNQKALEIIEQSAYSQTMKVHLILSNRANVRKYWKCTRNYRTERMFTNLAPLSLESSVVGTWKQFWHQARWARPNHPKQWITTQNTRLWIHVDNSNTNTFSAMKHIFFVFARTIPKWTPDRFCKKNESEIDGSVVICGKKGRKDFSLWQRVAKVKVDFERIE